MKQANPAMVLVVAALVVVGCSSPTASSSTNSAADTTAAAGQVSTAGGTPQAGEQAPTMDFASGRVKSVDGTNVLVSTATEVLTVKTSDQTRIMKTTAGSLQDINAGDTIAVRGTRSTDQGLTAQMIQLGDAGGVMPPGFGRGAGGVQGSGAGGPPQGQMPPPENMPQGQQPEGASGRPTPGAGGAGSRGPGNSNNFAIGQVKDVKGDTITLTTDSGDVSVKVGDSTLIQKTVSGNLSDLVTGERITTQGSRGSDNTFSAQAIQVGSVAAGGGPPGSGEPAPPTPATGG